MKWMHSTLTVETKGKGCSCLQSLCNGNNAIPSLVVAPQVQFYAGRNNQAARPPQLFIRDPDAVLRVINDAKHFAAQPKAPVVAAKRIFVAHASNPTAFQVVMLNGASYQDWAYFSGEVQAKMGMLSAPRFVLASINAPVTDGSMLSADDKIIAM